MTSEADLVGRPGRLRHLSIHDVVAAPYRPFCTYNCVSNTGRDRPTVLRMADTPIDGRDQMHTVDDSNRP
jgi:hypothetical protein